MNSLHVHSVPEPLGRVVLSQKPFCVLQRGLPPASSDQAGLCTSSLPRDAYIGYRLAVRGDTSTVDTEKVTVSCVIGWSFGGGLRLLWAEGGGGGGGVSCVLGTASGRGGVPNRADYSEWG